jgi:KilA-N domain
MKKITVEGIEIALIKKDDSEYISMTDIAKKFGEPRIIVQNWMRSAETLDFLAVWEQLHNQNFNRIEFDAVRMRAGGNAFTMSPTRWIETMQAIGITSKSGRYGSGTFGHQDIALEFCSWLSPIFKLYVIKEFQRLKSEENEASQLAFDWNVKRTMARANYKIHTDAVREYLIPPKIKHTNTEGYYFASEADLLNKALFGMTSKEWREQNPLKKGNIRDDASPEQLLVLSNLQSLNARLLKWDIPQDQRLQILNETAIEEIEILLAGSSLQRLPPEKLVEKRNKSIE